jgi:hypothetical protein
MLYVAIGRNVGDVPMEEEEFGFFRNEVFNLIKENEGLGSADTVAYGNSSWGDILEETCVMVWFDKVSPISRDTEEKLAVIAGRYGQDAIAYTVAPTYFVEKA